MAVGAFCVVLMTTSPAAAYRGADPASGTAGGGGATSGKIKTSALVVAPGSSLTVSGKVRPKVRRTVVLQATTGGAWAAAAKHKTTKKGGYAFAVVAPTTPGWVKFRVVAPKAKVHGHRLKATSTKSVTVAVVGTTPSITPTTTASPSPTSAPSPTPTTTTAPPVTTTPSPTLTPTQTVSPTETTTTNPYDATYYASALGLSGMDLRDELHEIIDDNAAVSYSTVWTALENTDEDPDNPANVIELYTGKSIAKTKHDAGTSNTDVWNREHVWAQSRGGFNTNIGPGTDLHHLRPEDKTVNSTRGNKDFDNGGNAVANCSGCYTDSNSFEPRAAVKGDVARMLFYMAIRYEGDDAFNDLELQDATGNQSDRIGVLSTLLAWNAADPPDAFEMRRNDIIYTTYQFNRNPFIDHPEWANAIWN